MSYQDIQQKRDRARLERLLDAEARLYGKPGSERIGREIVALCKRWGW